MIIARNNTAESAPRTARFAASDPSRALMLDIRDEICAFGRESTDLEFNEEEENIGSGLRAFTTLK
jgi:hypothetical protein